MTTPPTPAGWFPDPDGSGGQRYWDGNTWTAHRAPGITLEHPAAPEPRVGSHRAPDPEPAEFEPPYTSPAYGSFAQDSPQAFGSPPPAPPPDSGGKSKILPIYAAACAVLLLVLIGAIIYGFFIKDTQDVRVATPGSTDASETSEVTSTEPSESESATESTESPSSIPSGGEATDGSLSFVVHSFEVGSTVVSSSAPIEKDAQGEYVVVHMTVTNVSDTATTFLATFQTLLAGGTTYSIDDEATFYLDSGLAELAPGASADASIAFDVPPGTAPEAVMLHADPMSPGVEVALG